MSDVTATIRDISALTPQAQEACRLFLKYCTDAGLAVRITETYRSQARQEYLYEQGRTRPGAVVTWTKNSRHTARRAWDICKNVKGEEYSDPAFFKSCGAIAAQLDITWGGTWKTPDTPHFEITTAWKAPTEGQEEELDMATKAEYDKKIAELESRVWELEHPMIYNYVDENMPEWAREPISDLINRGLLKGSGEGLDLNDTELRVLVILQRTLQQKG
ncbi:MAG TPA: M15 family metallopeptidase [Candidatus Avimonoglobus intestinipullorum]|uniref:M15 family metallopeptidase n=1 Tax=Candidatus Avimonoglobus intestinipullorum TaxID=2840699 RepID=A0A9D1S6C5_9FIRM|nr:M15 family metallopeptidase [Candidatus Avimonoglobus intestinipullorum]